MADTTHSTSTSATEAQAYLDHHLHILRELYCRSGGTGCQSGIALAIEVLEGCDRSADDCNAGSPSIGWLAENIAHAIKRNEPEVQSAFDLVATHALNEAGYTDMLERVKTLYLS